MNFTTKIWLCHSFISQLSQKPEKFSPMAILPPSRSGRNIYQQLPFFRQLFPLFALNVSQERRFMYVRTIVNGSGTLYLGKQGEVLPGRRALPSRWKQRTARLSGPLPTPTPRGRGMAAASSAGALGTGWSNPGPIPPLWRTRSSAAVRRNPRGRVGSPAAHPPGGPGSAPHGGHHRPDRRHRQNSPADGVPDKH